ncbi:MAG: sigma-70 family RNA polymerase sigma factor [Bacteroidales bacterium]|jgi:RNA polymerase sigma-70 factor (ECF subfamily)|nr:sigma-70 family RNA polymerase sigma factor [Bacteroidales bacterium]MBR3434769.1 sigma-70 family RNA polymerase sigma factor [Bacteroidales bacterium]
MIDQSLSTLPDNELIQGYVNGNCACFDVLLARYQAKVYGYIFSVVKDKDVADDIFQDTFFKVVATLNSGDYKDENKFIHWVMRIAHNLIVDHFRRNSKMPIVPNRPDCDIVDTLKLHDENVEQNIMRQQTHRNVRKLVKMLPPEQRRVVILRHYGKCDFKDIAARTGVSINTALGRMRYAIINLRRLAEEHNIYLEL